MRLCYEDDDDEMEKSNKRESSDNIKYSYKLCVQSKMKNDFEIYETVEAPVTPLNQ